MATIFLESKKSQRFIILFTTVKKIIEMIKTGIDNNGVKREFDLVDYYEYTKLSFDELLNIVKDKISADDYISKYSNYVSYLDKEKDMIPDDLDKLGIKVYKDRYFLKLSRR